MMHTMNTTGYDSAFAFLAPLHALGALALFVGVVLLLAWLVKTLAMAQLLRWGAGLAVAGLLVSLLTIGVAGGKGAARWGGPSFDGGRTGTMQDMMRDDDDDDGYGMGMMHGDVDGEDDGMGMSMDMMSAMLKGKTGDAFDEAFLRMMIPHHQGAIDMAIPALDDAKHPELKKLAEDIIAAQTSEIDMMRTWLKDWGYDE